MWIDFMLGENLFSNDFVHLRVLKRSPDSYSQKRRELRQVQLKFGVCVTFELALK